MYIQPISYNVNMQGKTPRLPENKGAWKKTVDKIKQKIIDVLPEKTFEDSAKNVTNWSKWNEKISHPATNRFIMGATALATQPAIDYYNHKVDKETREVSRNRTIAKILAGVSVGMAVRGSCYELVAKMTNIHGKGRWSKALLPPDFIKDLLNNKNHLGNYRNALATSIAILAMLVTNFLIDAPLTVCLTNYFNRKSKENAQVKKDERTVLNV